MPSGIRMKKTGAKRKPPELRLPVHDSRLGEFLSPGGTFREGGLLVDKDGLRIIRQNGEPPQPLIKPSDSRLTLEDMDMVQVIGTGSSSSIVQLVQHKWTEQFFAVKSIQLNNVPTDSRKHIAKELKINYSLNHTTRCSHIVAYYQSFYDNGVISLVLEYMDGGSLADFLKKVKAIPESYLSAICQQVVRGLVCLHHEKSIVHRDLKPGNLLINHRGEIKITDFGVSAIIESSSGQQGTFVGTCHYMSPERISGGRHGAKSDIWSLGLVMLECATGQLPYAPPPGQEAHTSVFELLDSIVHQPPPSAPPDQFSEEFCSFVRDCVQKDPNDRKSALDLLGHPFLVAYACEHVDLAVYFANAGASLTTF